VSKNGLLEPFIFKNEHFTKTGSGQNIGKTQNKRPFFLRVMDNFPATPAQAQLLEKAGVVPSQVFELGVSQPVAFARHAALLEADWPVYEEPAAVGDAVAAVDTAKTALAEVRTERERERQPLCCFCLPLLLLPSAAASAFAFCSLCLPFCFCFLLLLPSSAASASASAFAFCSLCFLASTSCLLPGLPGLPSLPLLSAAALSHHLRDKSIHSHSHPPH
jgi:hypothetical protein